MLELGAAGEIGKRNFYSPDGQLLATDLAVSGSLQSYWSVFDSLGSLLYWLDDQGQVVQDRRYDVYGRVDKLETANESLTALDAVFGGRTYDAASGLYLGGERPYDPFQERFLSESAGGLSSPDLYRYQARQLDPIGFGRNYAARTDPYAGLSTWEGVGARAYSLFAGTANGVSFGHGDTVSGWLDSSVGWIYGDSRPNSLSTFHRGGWYTAGNVIGIVGTIAAGNLAAGALSGSLQVGRAGYLMARGYQGYSIAGDVIGVMDSYNSWQAGTFGMGDLLGFAPTLGWATRGYAGVRALGDVPWRQVAGQSRALARGGLSWARSWERRRFSPGTPPALYSTGVPSPFQRRQIRETVRSTHYSQSPEGLRLHGEAVAYRAAIKAPTR